MVGGSSEFQWWFAVVVVGFDSRCGHRVLLRSKMTSNDLKWILKECLFFFDAGIDPRP